MKRVRLTIKCLTLLTVTFIWAAAALVLPAHASPEAENSNSEGSLTIYKYARSDETTEPLKDVEFSAYRILDVGRDGNGFTYTATDGFREYLNSRNITADEFAAQSGEEAAAGIGDLQKYIEETGIGPTVVASRTDSTGYTKLSQLPLGWYLILETGAPDTVKEKSANFFISIPMLDSDGRTWVYDVTAYPKNIVTPVEPSKPDHPSHDDNDGGGGEPPKPPVVEIPDMPVPEAPGVIDEMLMTIVPELPVPTGLLELPKTGERVSGEMLLGAGLLMMALSCMMAASLERKRRSLR